MRGKRSSRMEGGTMREGFRRKEEGTMREGFRRKEEGTMRDRGFLLPDEDSNCHSKP